MKKIAYVGIDFLDSALKVLLDRDDIQIIKLFTCECDNYTEFNHNVISLCTEHNIEYTLARITTRDLEALKDAGCETLICAGYYYKLPVCDYFPMINIHPGLLPEARGAWPMPIAILRHYKTSGITIHKINSNFDEGDILLKESFVLDEREDLGTITNKINASIKKVLPSVLDNFDRIYMAAKKQGYGEYLTCPQRIDYTLTPDMPDADIDLILRAFYGYEVFLELNNMSYEIIGGKLSEKLNPDDLYIEIKPDKYIIAKSIKIVD